MQFWAKSIQYAVQKISAPETLCPFLGGVSDNIY